MCLEPSWCRSKPWIIKEICWSWIKALCYDAPLNPRSFLDNWSSFHRQCTLVMLHSCCRWNIVEMVVQEPVTCTVEAGTRWAGTASVWCAIYCMPGPDIRENGYATGQTPPVWMPVASKGCRCSQRPTIFCLVLQSGICEAGEANGSKQRPDGSICRTFFFLLLNA